jgi:hypothetical protein
VKGLAIAIVALVTLAPLAGAQERYPLWDVKHRSQFSVSSAYLSFSPAAEGGDSWRGVDLAAAYTYSLHPSLSLYTIFAHGFPFESADGQENQLRAAANLKVFPGADSAPSDFRVDLGAGGMWRGTDTVKDWTGGEAHLVISAGLTAALSAFGAYYHGFATQPGDQPDVDFVRIGLAARLGR